MEQSDRHAVTTLLEQIQAGSDSAKEELYRQVHAELQTIAADLMWRERRGHTLQPTALVNEAVLRLFASPSNLTNRRHFFAAAAEAMRRVLIDHARKHKAGRHGGGRTRIDLSSLDVLKATELNPDFLLDLDDALQRLDSLASKEAETFKLWYFGGLDSKDIAEQLGISVRTVQVRLDLIRTWLYSQLCA